MRGALSIAGTVVVALAAASCVGACTTNNFNCNVKDACRVPDAADAGKP